MATNQRPSAAVPRRVLLTVGLIAAALPVAIAAGRAMERGWIPTWDRSFPALRAADVFTRHSPLLGTRSSASEYGSAVSHPGPLEFQVLAPWVRLFGLSDGTALGVACLHVLCIVGVAWLAFRRGGHIAALLAMAAMASLAWSMGSEMLYDPWPPHVVVFPFALFLFAAWSTADLDFAALPVLVLSGSFVLQTHLGYAVLVPGVALVSLGSLGWRLWSERSRAEEPKPSRGRRRSWAVLALVTGLAAWALPLYEEISGRYQGNLGSLLDAAGGPRSRSIPFAVAVRLVGGTVALPPWWLPPSFRSPAVDAVGEGVSLPWALVGLCILATVLGIAAIRCWRRGRTSIATGLGLALATLPLAIYTADSAPLRGVLIVAYLRGLWVLAAFVGMMLALALADEVRHRRPAPAAGSVVAPAAVAAAALVAGVLAIPYAPEANVDPGRSVAATDSLAAQVLPAVRGRGAVLVEMSGRMTDTSWVGPGLLVELYEAGVPFVLSDEQTVRQLGNYRAYDGENADLRLTLVSGETPREDLYLAPGARLVARASALTPGEAAELERLRRELRDAIERAGGLSIELHPPVVGQSIFPGIEDELYPAIAAVAAVGDDPDELLDSNELNRLLGVLDMGFADVDDVFDPEAIPTDDLMRYGRLRGWPTQPTIAAYLEELPQA